MFLVFFIIGGGPESTRLEQRSEELKIRDVVRFFGAVASNRVPDIVAASDVLLFASDHEAWGLVANEAMSAGLPLIISANVGSAADLVVQDRTGILLAEASPDAMAHAITQLATNPERARQMGVAAQRHVRDGGWTLEGALLGWQQTIDSLLPEDALSFTKATSSHML
jgi:glycosyltransferase involved in cell wall biosynthesis